MKNYKMRKTNQNQTIQIIKRNVQYLNYKNMKNKFKFIEVNWKKRKEHF